MSARIALIAHDGRKSAMVEFANRHRSELGLFELIATDSTGKLISDTTGLDVQSMGHGPEGGDVLIAAEVVRGEVSLVFFFVEPRDVHPHDPDIQTLLRICNLHEIPLATNAASAELLLSGWMSERSGD